MGRLIVADALSEHKFQEVEFHGGSLNAAYRQGWNDAIDAIVENEPTVDAVPVVRCRDCKYWKTVEGVNLSKRVKFCTYHIGHQYARHDEDFCSRGERKDGGNG